MLFLALVSFSILASPQGADAQVPARIGFQGYLTDAGGIPLADGPWGIEIRLYNVSAGGSALWSQTESLTVTNGVFNAILGSVTPLTLPFNQTYWVGVNVDAQGELAPRTELASSPYAIAAASLAADSVRVEVGGLNRATFEADGDLSMRTAAGLQTARLRSENGGIVEFWNGSGQLTAFLQGSDNNNSGRLTIGNDLGQSSIFMEARDSGTQGAVMTMRNDSNVATIDIDAEENNGAGSISVRDATGQTTVQIVGEDAGGLGRVITDVVEILGGADLSERFDVSGTDIRPGMVVSIDSSHPGRLAVSRTEYDRGVAGIISGAGGVRPGMLMGQAGSIADGEYPVALTGRVWVWADATFGSITPGDLLTTCGTPGHAMRADDSDRFPGATLGKAMTSLETGRGLVLVLVSLQ